MSQALYRKYRSKTLSDVVGQNHITDILERSLKANKVAHAYLFTGPRGVGKTSIARILAHQINQLPYTDDSQHLDIIEIDAASNNGVDDVRLLREKAQIAPVSATKKVYIIDEVHMLSKPAFNALLKTLEEPPEHIVFILATTDVDKLPATIISRTQRYSFKAINVDDIVSHLSYIAKTEGIKIDDDALRLIAERGDGSFRDSISMLDQLSSLSDETTGITTDLIEMSLGLAPKKSVSELLEAVRKHDVKLVAQLLTRAESDGIAATVLCGQLTNELRLQAPDKPDLLPLLDALLDVPKASQPYIKLLSVLGSAAIDQKAKNAPLLAPIREVSASVEELSNLGAQATKKHPKIAKEKAEAKTPKMDATVQPQIEPTKSKKSLSEHIDFNWQTLLEHAHETSVALYSVLTKCEHELEGNTLTIYTSNAFYKKKIDDPKYHSHLYESLEATGGYQLDVHTVPTRAPMKDSTVAAIADIMGGGIEVSPEAS